MANLNTESITGLNSTIVADNLDNFGTAGVIITGTWVGTLSFEGSLDGVNFVSLFSQRLSTGFFVTSTTSNGQFLINVAGLQAIRIRFSAFTSGIADIIIQANAAIFTNRALSTLAGATDGTLIGNEADRLKVTLSGAGGSGGGVPATTNNIKFLDMRPATGGVDRQTAIDPSLGWVDLFNVNSSGLLFGFLLTLEGLSGFELRLIVDGKEIFNPTGANTSVGLNLDEILDAQIYAFPDQREWALGLRRDGNTLVYKGTLEFPMLYSTNVTIKIRRLASAKRFRAGLVSMTKET